MIQKIKGSAVVSGKMTPPSSKSYAQRAVAASLLAKGKSRLLSMELCSDTKAALGVVEALGAKVEQIASDAYEIQGGMDASSALLNIGESGLATRLFTPIASLWPEAITITGKGSILSRTMAMMIEPLNTLGVKVDSNDGFLPITVNGPIKGGEAEVDGSLSSQFLTGLLMALPLAQEDTILRVEKLNSIPYIDMTLEVLKSYGIKVEHNDYKEFIIKGQQSYEPQEFRVEGDWSGASCVLVAGAVAGSVTLYNMNTLSLQADVAIVQALVKAGAKITTTSEFICVEKGDLKAFEFDATQCPDLFPALAALASCCQGTTVIKGTSRLTHKESNRAQAISDEFAKMGICVDIETDDIMKITGGQIHAAEIDSHNDHRIAMAAAVAGLVCDGEMVIQGAECVDKSYPLFWDDIKKITSYE